MRARVPGPWHPPFSSVRTRGRALSVAPSVRAPIFRPLAVFSRPSVVPSALASAAPSVPALSRAFCHSSAMPPAAPSAGTPQRRGRPCPCTAALRHRACFTPMSRTRRRAADDRRAADGASAILGFSIANSMANPRQRARAQLLAEQLAYTPPPTTRQGQPCQQSLEPVLSASENRRLTSVASRTALNHRVPSVGQCEGDVVADLPVDDLIRGR